MIAWGAREQQWHDQRRERVEQWESGCDYDDFIDEPALLQLLDDHASPDPGAVREVIAQARENTPTGKMLSPQAVAMLANTKDPELWEAIFETADWIKTTVYGNRIVLFAPLYLANRCVNNCAYCGFRRANTSLEPKVLTQPEVAAEVEALVEVGHKRLVVAYGEHPDSDAEYICRTVKQVYATRKGWGEIRRCNINAAPMFHDEYRAIRDVGIGTYQIFQETYHRPTYAKVHPQGSLKGAYDWRVFGLHRALESGIDDVGLGVLFGLHDWRFELLGLLHHAMALESRFGVGPHTISYPRLVPAENAPLATQSRYRVSDEDFLKIVAIIRLMCPYTGSILTAREPFALRREAIKKCGVSQMDAGTRIGVGGYGRMEQEHLDHKEQFVVQDAQSLDDFIGHLCRDGYLPSFCTAGYREGRTGANFMPLAKHATVKNYCIANGLLTFKEYLMDYASDEVRELGERVIVPQYLDWVRQHVPNLYPRVQEGLRREEESIRDIHF